MIGYMYDDGGRAASGAKGSARDCVVRALAIVTNMDYADAYHAGAAVNRENGDGVKSARNGVPKQVTEILYKANGLRRVALPRGSKPTFTAAHRTYGNCVVTTTKHVCALIDGNLRDTNDCRTYEWVGDDGRMERRERKAMSVWIPAGSP